MSLIGTIESDMLDFSAQWFDRCVCVCFFSDYVYFETSSTAPYQIRRIEELCKVSILVIKFMGAAGINNLGAAKF